MNEEFPTNLFFSLPIELQSRILSHQFIPHFKALVGPILYHQYSVYFPQFVLEHYQEFDPTITLAHLSHHVQQLFDQYGYIFDPEDWYANYWNLIEIHQRLPDLQSREYQQTLMQIRQTSGSRLILSDLNLIYLPPIIGQLTQVRNLEMDYNQLTSLPESMGQLTHLEFLFLDHNHLTTLPKTMSQWIQLKGLYLGDNQLTDLPTTIGQLTHLRIHHLTRLPATIGQLVQLEYLDLSHNQLTHLPEAMKRLTQLQYLMVDKNQYHLVPTNLKSKLIVID